MQRRLVDLCLALGGLVVLAPVLLGVGLVVFFSDGRPVIYSSRRAGKDGAEFCLLKFRTMRKLRDENRVSGSRITAPRDERVFAAGRFLRLCKADELPQLLNIVKGEMSLFGPRPEDAIIVANTYTQQQLETLNVLPGVMSPGSLFNYTHGDALLVAPDVELQYTEKLLPIKLAIDRVYLERRNFIYDLRLFFKCIWIIGRMTLGFRKNRLPDEYRVAVQQGLLVGNLAKL